MKTLTILIPCLLFAISCSSPSKSEADESTSISGIEKLRWLEGNWVRTNDGEAQITYEQWAKTTENVYSGRGYTIRIDSSIFQPDTVFMEQIRIVTINDTLNFEVTGVNEASTLFKFIEQTDTSFVCVNPENEFPKKISYTLSNDHITALLSGRGPDIKFLFRRE
ncbi:MAG: hypothetical protein GY816_17840 [Cytophagales bacterium]|nr:hypothetical protein [Cytophagales bacterium]